MENNTGETKKKAVIEIDDGKKKKILIAVIIAVILVVIGIVVALFLNNKAVTAVTMRIQRLVGSVTLSVDGKDKAIREEMRLGAGQTVATGNESLLMVSLDETKLMTMEQNSEADIITHGKQLEFNLKEGSLFFNITEKLNENDLKINTSTMVCGIRGTSAYIGRDALGHEVVMVTDGVLKIKAINPVTHEEMEVEVHAGQMITIYLNEEAEGDKTISIKQAYFKEEDLPPVALDAMAKDNDLLQKVVEDTGFSGDKILALAELSSVEGDSMYGQAREKFLETGKTDSIPLMGMRAIDFTAAAKEALKISEGDVELEISILQGYVEDGEVKDPALEEKKEEEPPLTEPEEPLTPPEPPEEEAPEEPPAENPPPAADAGAGDALIPAGDVTGDPTGAGALLADGTGAVTGAPAGDGTDNNVTGAGGTTEGGDSSGDEDSSEEEEKHKKEKKDKDEDEGDENNPRNKDNNNNDNSGDNGGGGDSGGGDSGGGDFDGGDCGPGVEYLGDGKYRVPGDDGGSAIAEVDGSKLKISSDGDNYASVVLPVKVNGTEYSFKDVELTGDSYAVAFYGDRHVTMGSSGQIEVDTGDGYFYGNQNNIITDNESTLSFTGSMEGATLLTQTIVINKNTGEISIQDT